MCSVAQLIERRVFPTGKDPRGRAYDDLRWSRFKHLPAAEMSIVVGEHVFPFLRTLGGDDSAYAHHMKDGRGEYLRERQPNMLLHANPSFAGSLDDENRAKDLL